MTSGSLYSLFFTEQEHADLRGRIERLFDYLEVQRIRHWCQRSNANEAHAALMEAAEALDLIQAAEERLTEIIAESTSPYIASATPEDPAILRSLGIRCD